MPDFVVKGVIKAGIKGVGGVNVRIVSGDSGAEVAVAGPITTNPDGTYKFDSITLEQGAAAPLYRIKWDHATYGAREMHLVVTPKPGLKEGALDVIVATHPVWSGAKDPFAEFTNQFAKGPHDPSKTTATDHFYQVAISDSTTNTLVPADEIRRRLLAAAPKDSWNKTFDEARHDLVNIGGHLFWKTTLAPPVAHAPDYDLTANNTGLWDWLIWETEGNSDPKFQRGGKLRKMGLYKLNYDKLRKAGDARWRTDVAAPLIGGGWVKVAVLDCLDYTAHQSMIQTFLPSFTIRGGKVFEPVERAVPPRAAPVAASISGSSGVNALDIPPPSIVLPFNYDDNGNRSRALGCKLTDGVMSEADAERLVYELQRWATASRSTIAAFPPVAVDLTSKDGEDKKQWQLRPSDSAAWTSQIKGVATEKTLREFQGDRANAACKYYSVKTGVQYVSTVDQQMTSKDLLEENSIHAMNRSNLIMATMQRYGIGKFEGRYQLEVLCILIHKDPTKAAAAASDPTLSANPAKLEPYVTDREARIAALVSADEEGNSDAIFKIENEIDNHLAKGKDLISDHKATTGWDGIQIREVSNAGATDIWFPALAISAHGRAFVEAWATGQDWKLFWEKNFSEPLGRAKAEMLLYFGMQHMTSNAQNFLIAFDRAHGGLTGKLKYVILRDIGDTLYNDDVYSVLRPIDPLYEKEWAHESGDPFGVTLSSSLGNYAMPLMLRTGASIIFFFPAYYQGEIGALPDCFALLSRWSIKHNRAFLDYMREKIGYRDDWKSGPDAVDPATVESLKRNCELEKQYARKYKFLVPKILALNSTTRWRLINEIEHELAGITVNADAKRLVNAHEVLICAEIQEYIKSDAGKAAIRAFHGAGAPAPVAAAGPKCSKCAKASGGNTRKWQKCTECGMLYCDTCVAALPKHPQFKNPIYVNKKCEACDGLTDTF